MIDQQLILRVTEALKCWALTGDQVGVVAALAELHHGVDEVGHVVLVRSFGQEREVFLQDGPVVFFLDVCQLHLNKHKERTGSGKNMFLYLNA